MEVAKSAAEFLLLIRMFMCWILAVGRCKFCLLGARNIIVTPCFIASNKEGNW